MRPFKHTISITDALELIRGAAIPIERTERVRLDDADARVLAQPVVARSDVPPFERSAMDGYAVVAADTAGATRTQPRRLRCVEVVHTGRMPARAVGPGECAEIATGAPLPPGANAVIMGEETEKGEDGEIRVLAGVAPRQNVSARGSDMTAGAAVLHPGDVLGPSRLGALAAMGVVAIEVYAKPVVAILSTGDEIVDVGTPLGPAQIHDVNRYTLSAVVRRHGGVPRPMAASADNLAEIASALERAAPADVVVLSGGSSVGERDLVQDVLRAEGEILFHGIAVKPGKPTLLGRVQGKPVLGMPGNPTSCLSNAYLLLMPLLRRTARLPEHRPHTVALPLARRVVSAPGRHQFYTVRIADGAAVPAFKSSGDITSMSQADGYFEIDARTGAVEAGEMVLVNLF